MSHACISSCSVYGTGRIHCHSKLSVNYHRAINRAEKEPLDEDARPWRLTVCLPPLPAGVGVVVVGVFGCDVMTLLAVA